MSARQDLSDATVWLCDVQKAVTSTSGLKGWFFPTRYEVLLKYPRKPQWWASNRNAGIS